MGAAGQMPLLAHHQVRTILRNCFRIPQMVLGGIKLPLQSADLDRVPMLAFILLSLPSLLLHQITSQ